MVSERGSGRAIAVIGVVAAIVSAVIAIFAYASRNEAFTSDRAQCLDALTTHGQLLLELGVTPEQEPLSQEDRRRLEGSDLSLNAHCFLNRLLDADSPFVTDWERSMYRLTPGTLCAADGDCSDGAATLWQERAVSLDESQYVFAAIAYVSSMSGPSIWPWVEREPGAPELLAKPESSA